MHPTEFSVPVSMEVSVAHVLQGIFEIEGLLNYAGEMLTIEYQNKEMLSRSSKVATIDVPLDALRDVTFQKKITGSTITLRPKRLSAFEDVPISANALIVLSVKRRHRNEAEALVSHLQRVMAYRSTPDDVPAIPFHGHDVGLRKIKGVLYLEDDEFLVFDIQNALIGEFDRKQELIKVAPRALKDVRLEQRRFRDRLFIRPKSRDLLEAMPGSYADEVELKIHPKHRDRVERLIYELTRLSSREPPHDDESANAAGRTTGSSTRT